MIRFLENRGILLKETIEKSIFQQEKLLNDFLGPLMKEVNQLKMKQKNEKLGFLPLIKNELILLAKIILISLALEAVVSATRAAIQKNIYGLGRTTLIIPNKEIKYILEINKNLEESGLLKKDISKTIENEAKYQKGGFLSMLLGTIVSSLLGNMLAGKGVIRIGKELVTEGRDSNCCLLLRAYKLTMNKITISSNIVKY